MTSEEILPANDAYRYFYILELRHRRWMGSAQTVAAGHFQCEDVFCNENRSRKNWDS